MRRHMPPSQWRSYAVQYIDFPRKNQCNNIFQNYTDRGVLATNWHDLLSRYMLPNYPFVTAVSD